MTQTFIHRISNLKQYDSTTKTIIWKDPSKNRWGSSGVYSRLNPGDNVIFITDKKQKKAVLIGKVKSIEEKKGITCGDILELACTNEHLLGIAAMLPEKISQAKASLHPLIHPRTLNIEEIIKDITNKNFVAFHIVRMSKYSDIKSSFKPNDRIVIINNENTVENARIYNPEKNIAEQEEIPLNVKGLTLNQILDINKKEKNYNEGSNNVRRIKRIISSISAEGHYKFNGFWGFYDALINKKTYLHTQKKVKNTLTLIENPIILPPIHGEGGKGYKYKTNHLKKAAANAEIGEAGELLVIDWEKERLEKAGRKDLIEQIKHISRKDDNAGFDVLSFDKNGEKIFIEVKTTTQEINKKNMFFHITGRELEEMKKRKNSYFIYFVTGLNHRPKLVILKDMLNNKNFEMTPIAFIVTTWIH